MPRGKTSNHPWPSAPGGTRYAAMGRFRNAPHDVVIAIAEQIGGAWQITELRSVVEH